MQLSKGTTNSTAVGIKALVQGAVMCNASAVVMMHNHPSGNKKPSDADISLTSRVMKGLELFDIKLVDHIILTLDSYTSMAEEGLMQ
jgi:DNA repair protein RadC